MTWLTNHVREDRVHDTIGATELSNLETEYIFKRLKKHYKLSQMLVFWGDGGTGYCSAWRVRVDNQPELKLLVHEVAHAIQFKNHEKGRKWHTKKHERIMARIYRFALPKLDDWRALANQKSRRHADSIRKREEIKKEREVARKTPAFKLLKVQARIKAWESKRKRAENTLKRLRRREKLYLRLSSKNQMEGFPPSSSLSFAS